MIDIQQGIEYFLAHPSLLDKSSGKLISGKAGGVNFIGWKKEDIYNAKKDKSYNRNHCCIKQKTMMPLFLIIEQWKKSYYAA